MNDSNQTPHDAQDRSFVALCVREPKVHDIDRSAARAHVRVFRSSDGFEAAFRESVVERCREFARNAAPNEWYGVLLGRLCKDDGGRHVVVEGIVPDPDCLAGPGYFETTPESELRTRMTSDALFPDCVLLGWVHSHPHGCIRFSNVDLQNQAQWSSPDSLGVVIDPFGAADIGVYRGPQSELLEQVEDIVDAAARAQSATAPHVRASTQPATASQDENHPAETASAKLLSRIGISVLVAVCLFAALSGGLALRRTATLSSRVRSVEADVAELSEPFVSTIDIRAPIDHYDPVKRVCIDDWPMLPDALVWESTIK
jgi:proteasome lid subunit RPN8/RPN11